MKKNYSSLGKHSAFVLMICLTAGMLAPRNLHAGCNGHKVKWCFDYYANRRGYFIDLAASLRQRAAFLPGELRSKLNERAHYNSESSNLAAQIVLAEKIVQQQRRQIDLCEQWVKVASETSRDFSEISTRIRNSLPSIISAFSEYLVNNDVTLAQAIKRIDRSLDIEVRPGTREALHYQRDQLRKLRTFTTSFPNEAAAKLALNKYLGEEARENKSIPDIKIAAETLALLQEARAALFTAKSAIQLQVSLEKKIEGVLAKMNTTLAELSTELSNSDQYFSALKTQKSQVDAGAIAADAAINRLQHEQSVGIPAQIEQARSSEATHDLNWNCCDNSGHCDNLPDWNAQSSDGYKSYEFQISPEHHSARCRKGNE